VWKAIISWSAEGLTYPKDVSCSSELITFKCIYYNKGVNFSIEMNKIYGIIINITESDGSKANLSNEVGPLTIRMANRTLKFLL